MASIVRMFRLTSQLYSKPHRLAQRRMVATSWLQPLARHHGGVASAARVSIPRQPHQAASTSAPRAADAWQHSTGSRIAGCLQQIDKSINRSNRVSLAEVEHAIKLAQRKGRLDSRETVQLLRATGAPLRWCPPKEREALAELVWGLANRSRLDISHYNALLQTYLANETPFEPHEFLATLHEAGIDPNRVTYQRLIQRLCNVGNLAGATALLESTKSSELLLCQQICSALVRGHLLAGDETSARSVIDGMRQSGLSPAADIYTTLACGLIEVGRGDKALETIEGRALTDEQILRVVVAFARRDDLASVEETLARMPLKSGNSSEDIVNSCIELLFYNKLEAVLVVLGRGALSANTRTATTTYPLGKLLVRDMVASGRPIADVTRLCTRLAETTPETYEQLLTVAVQAAAEHADRRTAMNYVKLLQEHGHSIRHHYFFPILCKSSGESEIYDTLNTMASLDVSGFRPAEVLEYALPRLNCVQFGGIVERLTGMGWSIQSVVSALARHFLSRGDVETCARLLDTHGCDLSVGLARGVGNAVTSNNVDLCVQILKKVIERQTHRGSDTRIDDAVGHFLLGVPDQVFEACVSAVASAKLKIGQTKYAELPQRRKDCVERLLLDSVVEDDLLVPPFGRSATGQAILSNTTLSELESQFAKLDSNAANRQSVISRLLIAYCRKGDVEKAEDTLRMLEHSQRSVGVLTALIKMYLYKRDIENTLKFYEEAVTLHQGFILPPHRALKLATLAVDGGRLAEAKRVLSEQRSIDDASESMQRLVARFICTTQERYGVDETLNVIDEHVSKLTFVTAFSLSPTMKYVLEQGDMDGAVKLFKHLASRYHIIPAKLDLFLGLIREDRTDDLDEVNDVAKRLYGYATASSDLAVCYVLCGKTEKARELLSGLHPDRTHQKIRAACEHLGERLDSAGLERIGELLKVLGLNRGEILDSLIGAYCRVDNADEARKLWSRSQEENVILADQTLRRLADVLQRNGREVPFEVPISETQPDTMVDPRKVGLTKARDNTVLPSTAQKALAAEETLIDKLTQEGDIGQAFQMLKHVLQNLEATERHYPSPKVVRLLLLHMAQKSMIDEISSLLPFVNNDLQRLYTIEDSLCRAYVFAGRTTEALDMVDRRPATSVGLDFAWVEIALNADPEHFEPVLRIARRLAGEGQNYSLLNAVWMWLFANSQYEKADAILVEFPQILERSFRISKVLDCVRKSADEVMSDRLLGILKNTSLKRFYPIGFSIHIDILLAKGDIDKAHARVMEAQRSEGLDISECNTQTLQNLIADLSDLGKEAEFKLPNVRSHVRS